MPYELKTIEPDKSIALPFGQFYPDFPGLGWGKNHSFSGLPQERSISNTPHPLKNLVLFIPTLQGKKSIGMVFLLWNSYVRS
ncbi:hypothetical protein ES708_27502 [subsurface metagenome]